MFPSAKPVSRSFFPSTVSSRLKVLTSRLKVTGRLLVVMMTGTSGTSGLRALVRPVAGSRKFENKTIKNVMTNSLQWMPLRIKVLSKLSGFVKAVVTVFITIIPLTAVVTVGTALLHLK